MVEVVRKSEDAITGNEVLNLNNGSYVVRYTKEDEVIGTYIVTSYRGDGNGNTRVYCSLVNLDTGYIQFDERCSRSTTIKRVLSHLSPGDYGGNKSIQRGERIEVFTKDEVTLRLTLPKKKGYEER